MKFIITVLLSLFSICCSYGQYNWTEGELVLKNGKSLHGQIKLQMISKDVIAINGKEKVKYRKDKTSKKVKYDETQVEKVIFKTSDSEISYFEYIQTSEKKKGLFKIISSGKVTLYARYVKVTNSSPTFTPGLNGGTWNHSHYSVSNFNEFYVLRKSEKIATPLITAGISRSFKNKTMDYFHDCPSLISKLKNKTYKKVDIKRIVDEYNTCQ